MKILHIGLVSYYTEGMTYQENYLPDINAEDGHEVIFVANATEYRDGKLVYTGEKDYILQSGVRLIRYKYDSVGPKLLTNKIQKVSRLKKLMEEFKPDSIMFHGVCGYELMDVAKYVKVHPETLFYVDCHEDFDNTARTWLSKMFYKYIHGFFIKKSLPKINKILYIGEISRVYLKEMYRIDDNKLEFYPLGGIVSSKEDQIKCREDLIKEYGLKDDSTIFMHSGKLDPLKKTADLLRAFSTLDKDNIFLFIFGSIPSETEKEIKELIEKDNRVMFLGWKSGDEVTRLLNAADVYVQPGSPSATSQVAMCCGCAEIVRPTISYKLLYNESVLYADNYDELVEKLKLICDRKLLSSYKDKANECASTVLDYSKLANRYLH